jgi:hypothetical protein
MDDVVTEEEVALEEVEAPTNWYDGLELDDIEIGAIQNKGWKSPADAVRSYNSLEKLRGVPEDRLLKLPEEGSTDGWDGIYEKLGRPSDAKEYVMELPEGMQVDEGFMQTAQQTAFDNGISAKGFTELAKAYNEMQLQQEAVYQETVAQELEQQKVTLKNEWGSKHDEAQFIADKAMREMGLSEDEKSIIQAGIGYDGMYKMFNKIGDALSESMFVEGEHKSDFGRTPEQDKHEKKMLLDSIQADATRWEAYSNKVGPDYARMQQLYAKMAK